MSEPKSCAAPEAPLKTDGKAFGFQWHVTDRCNLRCRHCYQHRFDDGADLPLAALTAIAAGKRTRSLVIVASSISNSMVP